MNVETSEGQSFSDLYGYFCGMMTRGKVDALYSQMMGAIPDLGSVQGDITLVNQTGQRNNRQH